METFGKYQLLRRLAMGGMAQIFLARQSGPEGFEKLLVVKKILPHLAENDEFVRMFLDEARIAARLNHPNVVQIFDLGAQDDSYFIAMEYIHGEDVRKVWKRANAEGRPLPLGLICRIVMDACAGLDYAHKKVDANGEALNIVHRDISPQNILVTFDGGVKVVDFGIAKAADKATVTRSGVLKGKYSYMSPEQATGKAVDARTDVFALGVVFWELLTGMRLFKRESDLKTLTAVTECQVEPPSQLNPRLPKDLDTIVLRALDKSPDNRFPDANAFQLAIENWLLAHQIQSSSAYLAEFMQALYADRLQQPPEGLADPDEPQPPKDLDDPFRSMPISRDGLRSASGAPTGSTDEGSLHTEDDERKTPALRRGSFLSPPGAAAESSLAPIGEDFSHDTVVQPDDVRSRRWLWAALAVVLVFATLAVSWLLTRPPALSRATVHVTSVPSGVSLMLDGKPLPLTTPCDLPPQVPGVHVLQAGRAGFIDERQSFDWPVTGDLSLQLTLRPEKPARPVASAEGSLQITSAEASAMAIDDGPAVGLPLEQKLPVGTHRLTFFSEGKPVGGCQVEIVPDQLAVRFFWQKDCHLEAGRSGERVQVTVRSQPPGAQISINGVVRGRAPVTLRGTVGETAVLRAELTGYRDLERPVLLSADMPTEITLTLDRKGTKPRDPRGEDSRGYGSARFMLAAGAGASCEAHELGQAPLEELQQGADEYDDRFSQPKLGTLPQHVVARANETVRVTARY